MKIWVLSIYKLNVSVFFYLHWLCFIICSFSQSLYLGLLEMNYQVTGQNDVKLHYFFLLELRINNIFVSFTKLSRMVYHSIKFSCCICQVQNTVFKKRSAETKYCLWCGFGTVLHVTNCFHVWAVDWNLISNIISTMISIQ